MFYVMLCCFSQEITTLLVGEGIKGSEVSLPHDGTGQTGWSSCLFSYLSST